MDTALPGVEALKRFWDSNEEAHHSSQNCLYLRLGHTLSVLLDKQLVGIFGMACNRDNCTKKSCSALHNCKKKKYAALHKATLAGSPNKGGAYCNDPSCSTPLCVLRRLNLTEEELLEPVERCFPHLPGDACVMCQNLLRAAQTLEDKRKKESEKAGESGK